MQDQVELIRRIERQYLRDHLSALHLQMVDGMVIHLLFRRGPLRQEDIAQWIVGGQGARLPVLWRGWRQWGWWCGPSATNAAGKSRPR